MVAQIVFLREFLNVFYGNELVIGAILALWMAITGLGALCGKRVGRLGVKYTPLGIIFLLLGIFPATSVFLLRYARNLVFPPGTMIDFGSVLAFSSVVLFPCCFVAGLTFPILSHLLKESGKGENPIPHIYAWEALGSVVGGISFSLVLIFILSTFQTILIIVLLNASVAFLMGRREKRTIMAALSILALFSTLIFFIFFDLDKKTRQYLFPHQNLLIFRDTPYGHVTVTERNGQINFYENGLLLFSSHDPVTLEEAVHYAMARHPHPRHILLVSGGFAGLVKEILKYREVLKVDYVELNPTLTELGKVYDPSLGHYKVNIINKDARLFIKESKSKYDVVLINLPDPVSAQINRFYTDEFFRELKASLDEKSIVSLGLTSSADYLSKEARAFKGSILTTIKNNFIHVTVVAASKDFILASDSPLEGKIIPLLEKKGIANIYLNRNYIDDELMIRRSGLIMESLSREKTINRDFSPIAYLRSSLLWLSAFEKQFWLWPALVFVIILSLMLFRSLNTITYGIFTAGFSASSLEIIVLFSFQIIYGYVYQMLGIIITAFMAGLGLGALYKPRAGKPIFHFVAVQYGSALFCLIFPLLLTASAFIPPTGICPHLFFIGMMFLMALLIGATFSLASLLNPGHVASRAAQLYGIDLMGAAMGALIISALLIPLMGLIRASFLLAFLNIISGTVALINKNKFIAIGSR